MRAAPFAVAALLLGSCSRAGSQAEPSPAASTAARQSGVPFVLSIRLERVTGGAEPVLHGTTNLPDGTDLSVMIDPHYAPDWQARLAGGLAACDPMCGGVQANAIVSHGEFAIGPFIEGGAELHFVAGTYNVHFVEGPNTTPDAQAMLGDGNRNMGGPLTRTMTSNGYASNWIFYTTSIRVAGLAGALGPYAPLPGETVPSDHPAEEPVG